MTALDTYRGSGHGHWSLGSCGSVHDRPCESGALCKGNRSRQASISISLQRVGRHSDKWGKQTVGVFLLHTKKKNCSASLKYYNKVIWFGFKDGLIWKYVTKVSFFPHFTQHDSVSMKVQHSDWNK